MNELLLAIAALAIGFLISHYIEKRKSKICKSRIQAQDELINVYFRLIEEQKAFIVLLENYNLILQKEIDDIEKEKQSMLDSRLIVTPEIFKQLQPITEDVAYAYRLYFQLATDPKFVFKINDNRENARLVNAIHGSIMIFGIEGTKQLYIGTMLKELLYKTDEEVESDLMPVSRKEYLLTTSCMMEKLIDKLSTSALPENN